MKEKRKKAVCRAEYRYTDKLQNKCFTDTHPASLQTETDIRTEANEGKPRETDNTAHQKNCRIIMPHCLKTGKKEEKDIFFLNKGCNLPAVCYII